MMDWIDHLQVTGVTDSACGVASRLSSALPVPHLFPGGVDPGPQETGSERHAIGTSVGGLFAGLGIFARTEVALRDT